MVTSNSVQDQKLRPAVFLDRDGTINVEKEYLYRIEDFEFILGAPEAIKMLKAAGYLVVVVTNQSGVARGYYSLEEVERLHVHIQCELKKHNTCVDAFYVCSHHPTEGIGEYKKDCGCRKPKPGMLRNAADDLGIDFGRSWIVGDKLSDLRAGFKVGVKSLLVTTGYGLSEKKQADSSEQKFFPNILDAAKFIISQSVELN